MSTGEMKYVTEDNTNALYSRQGAHTYTHTNSSSSLKEISKMAI